MGTFLQTYNLPTMNHEEIEHVNRLITGKKIESIIKNLQKTKVQDQETSPVISTKRLKKN